MTGRKDSFLRRTGPTIVLSLVVLVAAAWLALVFAPEAVAGVGGIFVKAVRTSFWLQALLAVAAAILLPLFLYVLVREGLAVHRTKRDMAALAVEYPYFDWPLLKARIQDAVVDIYHVWGTGDLSPVAEYMTPDYLESQQDMLDRWKEEGKRNVVTLHSRAKVKPLTVDVGEDDVLPAVWVMVVVDLVDYMEEIGTGRVLKGKKKKKKDFEAVWMFAYDGEAWRLGSIEDGMNSLEVASRKNQVDTYFLDRMAAARVPAAVPSSAAEEADDESEESGS